ncbi:MAG: hypothetical protein HY043_20605 [Verrucomicrobia bacterium]|nr:hypothetical protein [Verrucomicrobiota bacterium]
MGKKTIRDVQGKFVGTIEDESSSSYDSYSDPKDDFWYKWGGISGLVFGGFGGLGCYVGNFEPMRLVESDGIYAIGSIFLGAAIFVIIGAIVGGIVGMIALGSPIIRIPLIIFFWVAVFSVICGLFFGLSAGLPWSR